MYTIWVIWKQLWLRRLKSRKTAISMRIWESIRLACWFSSTTACVPAWALRRQRAIWVWTWLCSMWTKAHGSWKQSAVSLWMATRANTCWKPFRWWPLIAISSVCALLLILKTVKMIIQKRFWISSSSIRVSRYSLWKRLRAIRCRLLPTWLLLRNIRRKNAPKWYWPGRRIRVHFHRLFPIRLPTGWMRQMWILSLPIPKVMNSTRSLSVVRKWNITRWRLLKERISFMPRTGLVRVWPGRRTMARCWARIWVGR